MHGGAETAPGAQHCLERRQRLRREQCLLNCCCLSRNGALRPSAHGQSLTKPNWTASRNHDFRLGKHFRATTAQAQVLGFRMPAIPAIVCSCKNREIPSKSCTAHTLPRKPVRTQCTPLGPHRTANEPESQHKWLSCCCRENLRDTSPRSPTFTTTEKRLRMFGCRWLGLIYDRLLRGTSE